MYESGVVGLIGDCPEKPEIPAPQKYDLSATSLKSCSTHGRRGNNYQRTGAGLDVEYLVAIRIRTKRNLARFSMYLGREPLRGCEALAEP